MVDTISSQVAVLQSLYRAWSAGKRTLDYQQLSKQVRIEPTELISVTGPLHRLRQSGYVALTPEKAALTLSGLDFFESHEVGLPECVDRNLTLERDILRALKNAPHGLLETELPHYKTRVYRASLRYRLMGHYISRDPNNRIVLLLSGRRRLQELEEVFDLD